MRELAGHEPGRYAEVLQWKVADALDAYEHRLWRQARRDYDVALQIWAALASTGASRQKRPPEPPPILRQQR